MKKSSAQSAVKILIVMVLALLIGAVFVLAIGENPFMAYAALLKGAFGSPRGFGTTIQNFTPLLVTSVAFAIAAKAGAFNVGVEGEVILGGLTAAYIGAYWSGLPKPILLVCCFLGSMLVAAAWAFIPAALKAYFNVSEVCVTILMNTVATYIGSYMVSGPMSAGASMPKTKDVAVMLPKLSFLQPSSANVGLFLAIAAVVLVIWMLYKTRWGFKIRAVGTNPDNAQYAGIDSKKIFISAMLLSGALGGFVGCIEVLGVHGYYLDNFATGLGSNGMLAALIVKSNVVTAPLMGFFLAVLKSGSMAMQQSTGVPKAIVDTISAVFIIIATMDFVIDLGKKRKNKVAAEGGRGKEA